MLCCSSMIMLYKLSQCKPSVSLSLLHLSWAVKRAEIPQQCVILELRWRCLFSMANLPTPWMFCVKGVVVDLLTQRTMWHRLNSWLLCMKLLLLHFFVGMFSSWNVARCVYLETCFSTLWSAVGCQLPTDVLRLKERCAVTSRELAVRLSSPHVTHIRQSCDVKVGFWQKLITPNVLSHSLRACSAGL